MFNIFSYRYTCPVCGYSYVEFGDTNSIYVCSARHSLIKETHMEKTKFFSLEEFISSIVIKLTFYTWLSSKIALPVILFLLIKKNHKK